jgi:hypothetical protein
MNDTNDTAGRVFPSRKAFEEHKKHRESILNPPKPRPKVEAVKIKHGDRMFAGKIRAEGSILLVFPEAIPDPFISKETARELVDNGYATPATPEEIAAFLDAQETPNPSDQ